LVNGFFTESSSLMALLFYLPTKITTRNMK
jgi:hypothetical protein